MLNRIIGRLEQQRVTCGRLPIIPTPSGTTPSFSKLRLSRSVASTLHSRIRSTPSNSTGAASRPYASRSAASSRPQPVDVAYDEIKPNELRWPNQNMVICHGLFGSKSNWRRQARRLADSLGMTVYTLDMRNHGRSPHATPHTSLAMAQDIAAFFRSRGLSQGVHLVGHSMGAKSSMTLALDPSLSAPLSSLTVVDMAPTTEPIEPQYADYARGMMEVEAAKVSTRLEAEKILEKYEPLASTRQFLLTNAMTTRNSSSSSPCIRFRCALQTLADAIPTLGEFPYTHDPPEDPPRRWSGPTLFLRGGQSEYVTSANLPAARAFFPNMKLVTIDKAGHWVHAEAPDETTDAIERFSRAL